MTELTTSIENIEIAKDLLVDSRDMKEIRAGNTDGEEAICKVISLVNKSLGNGVNISFKKIGKYYSKAEKEKIKNVVLKNSKDVQLMVETLLAETKIDIEYIANHVVFQIKKQLPKLIGETYFDILEKNSKGDPIFVINGLVSDEELRILAPNETFTPPIDLAKKLYPADKDDQMTFDAELENGEQY